jgi:NAD(P)H-hydrate epimerase
MSALPFPLYTSEQVRQLDRYVIDTLGISGTVLMERAGAAAFVELQKRWLKAKRIVIVCGSGNNAGDGFVLARLAKAAGYDLRVLQVGDPSHLHGDAFSAAQRLQSMDVILEPLATQDLRVYDVIVDALLGTGLKGEVSGDYAAAIQLINQAQRPVFSLDIPSGLEASDGVVFGHAVHASCTLSFLGLKRGLFTGDGPDYAGAVVFDDLKVPAEVYQQLTVDVERIDYPRFKSVIKPRPRAVHKGDCGHVLVVGGEHGFSGAARMAGEAALRCGAGLVSIATRHSHAAMLNANRPELMVHGVETEVELQRLVDRADVIAIGPGLGSHDWGQRLFQAALESGLPLVVDADALNLLAQHPQQREQWVLTPHVGEAARLLGRANQEVHHNRFTAVRDLQKQFGGLVVLKGAGSLIAAAEGPLFLCSEGNPGMASGGMGDILTGTIASFIAQGFGLSLATYLGVVTHAAAGDAAAKAAGERGLLASDLMSWLRRLVNPA